MTNLTQARVKKLYALFQAGKIPTLAKHEVNPGLPKSDRLNYLYFTLPVCINFQRNSPAMWRSALQTWEDRETQYVFYPEQVTQQPRDRVQVDLAKHNLALQRNKHTDIWLKIANTLHKHFENDPQNILKANDYDVVKVLEMIRKQRKLDFPYLSGTKLSNYWLFILRRYTDVALKNIQYISIIPDTHVVQSSIQLRLIPQTIDTEKLVVLWRDLLEGTGINPIDMHPVLWNWSRNKFQPTV